MDIRTSHDWPSQMHENVFINRVKTRPITSYLADISDYLSIAVGVCFEEEILLHLLRTRLMACKNN